MQKVADAWAMRVRGADWATIAGAVGYASPQNAMRAVRNYAGRLPELTMPELRSMWRERLEALWPIAFADVERGKRGATRAAVAIAQRAAALDGLDAPARMQVEASAAELDAMVRVLLTQVPDRAIEASIWDEAEDAEVLE